MKLRNQILEPGTTISGFADNEKNNNKKIKNADRPRFFWHVTVNTHIFFIWPKNEAIRSKSKDWFIRNQDSVSGWNDMSTHGLLFQWASTIKVQLSVLVELVQSRHHQHLIESNFLPWYSWKIVYLALNNTHSLICHFYEILVKDWNQLYYI